MAPSSDRAAGATATEIQQCTTHGPFEAKRMYGDRFTRCPTCTREAEERWAVRRAEEQRQAEEQRAAALMEHRLQNSGLVGRFERATFETFLATTDAQRRALQACQALVAGDLGSGWLIGPPGVGKTLLASAMVRHVICERRRSACIHGVHEIMQMLRERMNRKEPRAWEDEAETMEGLRDRLGQVALLVLDEIGVSRGSDWEAEQLFTIIDLRYRLERPTVLLSNLPAPEIKQALGDRVYDRLREGSRIVPMVWDSYRGSRA